MNRDIRACLFDLDGVIVATDHLHYQAWKQLADQQGWAFDESVNRKCRGIPRLASLQVILDHNGIQLDETEAQRLCHEKNEHYRGLLEDLSPNDRLPGITGLLDEIRTAGLRIGLCSSSRNAETVITALQLADHFDCMVTGGDIINAKPDPEIFLRAAGLLSVPPGHCCVFEDAEAGITAAEAAGMLAIGVGLVDVPPAAAIQIHSYSPELLQRLGILDIANGG
ncbi:MAG: beta-phosphoglucomutase [Planctomycetota bacterium]